MPSKGYLPIELWYGFSTKARGVYDSGFESCPCKRGVFFPSFGKTLSIQCFSGKEKFKTKSTPLPRKCDGGKVDLRPPSQCLKSNLF